LRQTPEQIVETALQEDVDVIGLSILSGAHRTLFPRITELLKQKDLTDVLVVAGGIIPEEDVPEMKELGIKEIFGPGTPTDKIVQFVLENIPKRT
jgi:methylmalonyl-CoA mutase C-terminal domain/subunit